MPLALNFSRQAGRFMDKLERANNSDWRKIWSRLENLPSNPLPPQAGRMSGCDAEIYRLRVGDYRIIYSFDDETMRIFIIERRSKAYQKFRITFIQSGGWQP
ncbi:MAG: type II toxin-antitoxin system RelE family toxin [Gammaproteobacteria bacterium]